MAATLSPHLSDEDLQARKGYDKRLVRRLFVYVRPYGTLVAGALVLLMTEGLLQLVGPLMTERVIDVALPHKDAALAWRLAVVYAASLIAAWEGRRWRPGRGRGLTSACGGGRGGGGGGGRVRAASAGGRCGSPRGGGGGRGGVWRRGPPPPRRR